MVTLDVGRLIGLSSTNGEATATPRNGKNNSIVRLTNTESRIGRGLPAVFLQLTRD